jgi:hypothetical protein
MIIISHLSPRVCRHRQSFINSDNLMATHLLFSRDEEKNQHFDKVRRYSKSRFLLTDFCKVTHPTATALRLGWGPVLDRNIRSTVSPRIYLSRAVNAVCL